MCTMYPAMSLLAVYWVVKGVLVTCIYPTLVTLDREPLGLVTVPSSIIIIYYYFIIIIIIIDFPQAMVTV